MDCEMRWDVRYRVWEVGCKIGDVGYRTKIMGHWR